MALVQELQSAKVASALGWAYVPDTGFDPSKAPLGATGSRKRGTRPNLAARNVELSVRQQTKIEKHLEKLQDDNLRDVQFVIPGKARDAGNRGLRGKMTPGVKKILLSQKTFKNHLDDEKAFAVASQADTTTSAVTPRVSAGKGGRNGPAQSKHLSKAATGEALTGVESMDIDSADHTNALAEERVTPSERLDPSLDDLDDSQIDHLITSATLRPPSPATINALLSAPPLTYDAARAGPSTSSAPPRQFCEMCGYWGRVLCIKCGARICGLECKGQHDETRCLKFYA